MFRVPSGSSGGRNGSLLPPASRSSPHSLALTPSPSNTGPIPSLAAVSAVSLFCFLLPPFSDPCDHTGPTKPFNPGSPRDLRTPRHRCKVPFATYGNTAAGSGAEDVDISGERYSTRHGARHLPPISREEPSPGTLPHHPHNPDVPLRKEAPGSTARRKFPP